MASQLKSRARLTVEANIWRFLMNIGMVLHRRAPPRPMRPSFTRYIPAQLARLPGEIKLVFYVPPHYHSHPADSPFPCIVSFHGGGFTIGQPEDDATWADACVRQLDAVVVSVGYRLAPKHYFPTPVDDCADAILYLVQHASELNIDPHKLCTSGFSAGGNLAFTAALRLAILREEGEAKSFELPAMDYTIRAVAAFYPCIDFTNSRHARRASTKRIDKNLPLVFSNLFDASYLYTPDYNKAHPLLSPGVAPDWLIHTLPQHLHFYTAEWDDLLNEAQVFRDRLVGLGKQVRFTVAPEQVHAWDRSPNPFKRNKLRAEMYAVATDHLARAMEAQLDDSESTSATTQSKGKAMIEALPIPESWTHLKSLGKR
ncbi:Alpha/Beta hydrolase protein [Protomyces lactucae-debilis]|uniref:Alpha/Beta hydrolase protein n=1 Tax=Protomyces lactucae-debilis TaxID=2754530 RepID=A0A1Y2EYI1_PROLT|nr:Alpha/Beta hydrolase protein [Protomyces lactucae-debilis]ORY76648.1 Alpha/Beta hydrolase protein [Protomyces lactucae-debilis]